MKDIIYEPLHYESIKAFCDLYNNYLSDLKEEELIEKIEEFNTLVMKGQLEDLLESD